MKILFGKLSPRLVDLLGTYAALVAFPLGIAVTLALAKFVDGRSEESFAAQQKTQPVHSLPLAFVAWLLVPVVFFILANARIATVWGERFILPTAVAIAAPTTEPTRSASAMTCSGTSHSTGER